MRLWTEAQLIALNVECAVADVDCNYLFLGCDVALPDFNVGFNYDVIYCIESRAASDGSRERAIEKDAFSLP